MKKEENMFKHFYDKVPIWIFTCKNDDKWTMIDTNSRITNILGYSEEEFKEVKHSAIASVIPEPYLSKVRKYTKEASKNEYGLMKTYVTPVIRKDGSYCWLNVELYWEKEQDEGIWYVSCSNISSIHERYQEELRFQDAIKDQDVLLRTTADITTDLVESIFTVDELTLKNQSKTFSGGVEQLASRAYKQEERDKIIYELSYDRMIEALDTSPNYNFEYTRHDKYNHPSIAQVYVHVFRNLNNKHIMAFVYLKNVNNERKLQKVLNCVSSISEETLALLYCNSNEVEFLKRDKYFNDIGSEDISIYKDSINQLIDQYIVEEHKEEAKKAFDIKNIENNLKDNDIYVFSFAVQYETRQYKKWQFTYYDKENHIVIYKRTDISDIIKEQQIQNNALEDAFEQAKQASLSKGQFLSRMSHEIRTPLNAVIGYMMMGKEAKDDSNKMLHCINSSEIAAKHLLNIINDVLDISSIESGKMKIAVNDFDLKGLISEITTVLYQQAKKKKINFSVNIKELSEEWVVGDRLRVNQILMNLLSNAVKFTPKDGTVQLNIEQLHKNDNRIYINFEVRDTGIGMSKEYLNRLFEPFEQETASTAQIYGGSGLGLSITKNLIDMMGGNIKVDSKQNEGTSFKVTLYFNKSLKNDTMVTKPKNYGNVRVLVVDDIADEGKYIKRTLKQCKVKSDTVTSGKEALKQLQRRMNSEYAYDMCILDWNMPDLNGIETAKEIRKIYGDKLPILIATAYDISEIEQQAYKAGVNKVIAKPLFPSTMFDLLVSHYGKYDPDQLSHIKLANIAGLKVILAEDNEMNMEIAIDVLHKAGVLVEPATNGQIAVDKFLQSAPGSYDLILMDIQMPILNGYQACQVIRNSNHQEAKSIPIIAMTANAFVEDVTEALANGMNDHISKPIDKAKLINVIAKYTN